tara:strand:- start:127 stop:345 length:219 start_codon:yes stop_codon:yes gene_type:complete
VIDLKVKLKTGRKNKKEELVLAVENELLYIGFYDQNIKEYITFNLKSIPKIVDTLLYMHNMITRLNKEEDAE